MDRLDLPEPHGHWVWRKHASAELQKSKRDSTGRLRANHEHLFSKGRSGLGTIHKTHLTTWLSHTQGSRSTDSIYLIPNSSVPGSTQRKWKVPLCSPLAAKTTSKAYCLTQAHFNPRLCRRLLWSQEQNQNHQHTTVQTCPNTSKTQAGSKSWATGLQGAIAIQCTRMGAASL